MSGKLILLLAVALIWSSIQCVATCVTGDSSAASGVPPCHRHSAPAQTASACPHEISVADAVAQITQFGSIEGAFSLEPIASSALSLDSAATLAPEWSVPPLTILRV